MPEKDKPSKRIYFSRAQVPSVWRRESIEIIPESKSKVSIPENPLRHLRELNEKKHSKNNGDNSSETDK